MLINVNFELFTFKIFIYFFFFSNTLLLLISVIKDRRRMTVQYSQETQLTDLRPESQVLEIDNS